VACTLKRIIAAAGVSVAACGSPPSPSPPPSSDPSAAVIDVACGDYHGPNAASQEFYQQQYLTLVVKPLDRDRSAHASAIKSPDTQRIGDTAARLSDELDSEMSLFKRQPTFGCYDQTVLERLAAAEVAYKRTLREIASAARSGGASRIPSLVDKAKPQEQAFVKNLNVYASQFGGQPIDQP